VRSTLRVHNTCADAIDVICELPYDSSPLRSVYERRDERRTVPISRDERDGTRHTPSESEDSSCDDEGGGDVREVYTLSRTVSAGAVLELPLWAHEPRASMRLKRASSSRWDTIMCPISPRAATEGRAAASSFDSNASAAEERERKTSTAAATAAGLRGSASAGSAGAKSAGWRAPGMKFFEVSYTTSPLLDAASNGGGFRSTSADLTLVVAWRAKLLNLLPVDVEFLAGGDGGAMDGGMMSSACRLQVSACPRARCCMGRTRDTHVLPCVLLSSRSCAFLRARCCFCGGGGGGG
jgi:hypothetical protein